IIERGHHFQPVTEAYLFDFKIQLKIVPLLFKTDPVFIGAFQCDPKEFRQLLHHSARFGRPHENKCIDGIQAVKQKVRLQLQLELLQLCFSHHGGSSLLSRIFRLFIAPPKMQHAGDSQAAHEEKIETPPQRGGAVHEFLVVESACRLRHDNFDREPDAYQREEKTDGRSKPQLSSFRHKPAEGHDHYRGGEQHSAVADGAVQPRQARIDAEFCVKDPGMEAYPGDDREADEKPACSEWKGVERHATGSEIMLMRYSPEIRASRMRCALARVIATYSPGSPGSTICPYNCSPSSRAAILHTSSTARNFHFTSSSFTLENDVSPIFPMICAFSSAQSASSARINLY